MQVQVDKAQVVDKMQVPQVHLEDISQRHLHQGAAPFGIPVVRMASHVGFAIVQ